MNAFVWQSSSWLAHPWTLWTAPLVHLSAAHAIANVTALAAVCGLVFMNRGSLHLMWRFTIGMLLAWPLSTFTLIFCPEVTYYVGLSGFVHAGVSLLAILMLRSSRYVGAVLLTGLSIKLYLEQGWVRPVVWSSDWGFNVVVVAHLYGAVVGLCVGAMAMLFVPPERGADAKRGGK